MIAGYAHVTDAQRVRQQAEAYLAKLVGGPVTVERASLSLFEGLRLEGVTIRTPVPPGEPEPPDAVLFTARSVRIDYNPLDLLLGKLSAERVVAVDPHVRLTEDVGDETWNFQRLQRRRRPEAPERPSSLQPPEELPEILLRNAQVDYAQLVGDTLVPRRSVGIEAQLTPAAPRRTGAGTTAASDGAYRFAVQTRGLASGAGDPGPRASGTIDLHGGRVEDARLEHVNFAALLDVLPRAAADWWRRHDITGRLTVHMRLDWDDLVEVQQPDGTLQSLPQFRVVVDLEDAQIQGLPDQWLPPEEVYVRQKMTAALDALRQRLPPRLAGGVLESALRQMSDRAELRPVRLRDVEGSFVFTEAGVWINGVVGDLEGNRLRVDGLVNGYHPDAPLSLVVQNADAWLSLPADVPYVASLPRQVREIYERFLPMGRCRLRLELHRPAASPGPASSGGETAAKAVPRPIVTGFVDVLDGTFTLDRFPYPVRNARGRLLLRYDRATQQDQLVIENLRGTGVAGGPNQDAELVVDGVVGPLTSVAGFDITVTGRNVRNEPLLIEALPKEARQTIANFDHAHHGRGRGADGGPPPEMSFGGDFRAHVSRPAGRGQRWSFRVDLALADVNGAFFGFPYPLEHATADVSVFSDHVEIARASMTRLIEGREQPAQIDFRGRVDWGRRPSDPRGAPPPVRLDLSVAGTQLPTDAALWGALPSDATQRLKALGLGGTADVAARVFTDAQDAMSWDVTLELAEGRFWPETGTFSLSDATGTVRVLPDRVLLSNVVGRRGEGTVAVNGTVELAPEGVTDVTVSARNVTLDTAIYELLPPAAQEAWNWLRPAGATDAEISFRGPTALLTGEGGPGTLAQPEEGESAAQYEVILRPQGISALPEAFAYAVQDVRGTIRVVPGRIELAELTGVHGLAAGAPPARLSISGIGELGAAADGGDVWTLAPTLADTPIDDELLAALPEGLAETLRSLKVVGRVTAAFKSLHITTHPAADAGAAAPIPLDPAVSNALAGPPASRPGEGAGSLTVVFDARFTTQDVAMDVGVPLSRVAGEMDLTGAYQHGELHALAGNFRAPQFAVSDREGRDLAGAFALPPGGRTLAFENISAEVAGGRLGGGVTLTFGETEGEPARFAVEMAVREADVRRLVGDQPGRDAADVQGRLTARLDVEGVFGDVASRRGRGEVVVEGRKLYDLPLVLGLLQVTNLAMPIAEPFREATATFSVDGPRIVFEQIALRAADMQMNGEGTLNFQTQKVDLSFTTSNHGWAKIPLLGEMVGLARNELLRIHVRGTLKSPEVGGSTLPTITSTIDEVFRRD